MLCFPLWKDPYFSKFGLKGLHGPSLASRQKEQESRKLSLLCNQMHPQPRSLGPGTFAKRVGCSEAASPANGPRPTVHTQGSLCPSQSSRWCRYLPA